MVLKIIKWDKVISGRLFNRPPRCYPFWRGITLIGSPVAALLVSGSAAVLLWLRGEYAPSYALVAGCVVTAFGMLVMKHTIRRARPATDYAAAMFFGTPSFPSGHALGAGVQYNLGGYLIASQVDAPGNAIVMAGIFIFGLLISYSRIYLGAHYVLDVVAGYVMGLGATLAIIALLLQ